MGLKFETLVADLDENYPAHLKKEEIPLYLAKLKADFLSQQITPNDVLITADTIVWHNGRALNKPQDKSEAFQMLSSLSGATHSVFTGVHVSYANRQWHQFDETKVTFNSLTSDEIQYYIEHYSPFDKAGSYGAQDFIGIVGVHSLQGSYFNVMGLPTHLLFSILKSI